MTGRAAVVVHLDDGPVVVVVDGIEEGLQEEDDGLGLLGLPVVGDAYREGVDVIAVAAHHRSPAAVW